MSRTHLKSPIPPRKTTAISTAIQTSPSTDKVIRCMTFLLISQLLTMAGFAAPLLFAQTPVAPHRIDGMPGPRYERCLGHNDGIPIAIGTSSQNSTWQSTVRSIARLLIKVATISNLPHERPRSLLSQVLCGTIRVVLTHKFWVLCVICFIIIDARLFETDKQRDLCWGPLDSFIDKLSESEKMTGAAATTLMTLVPALLVFGHFPTAEIQSIMSYSSLAGLLTVACTMGLSTSSLSTMAKNRIFRVADFCTPSTIQLYG